jgi:hypothetical protein
MVGGVRVRQNGSKAIVRVYVDVLPHVSTILESLPNREKRAVTDVKPFQVWDVRENEKAPWREAVVINVSLDAVELQFLDMPRAPYVARTFKASWSRMKGDKKRYRLVRGPK